MLIRNESGGDSMTTNAHRALTDIAWLLAKRFTMNQPGDEWVFTTNHHKMTIRVTAFLEWDDNCIAKAMHLTKYQVITESGLTIEDAIHFPIHELPQKLEEMGRNLSEMASSMMLA